MKSTIKKVTCQLWCFAISLGYARAASILAREGKYQEAKNLMLEQSKDCCC